MGPVSKSAKKSKTPGPQGQKKTNIMNRKAFSEGGPATKKSKKFEQAGANNAQSKTPRKADQAFPKKVKLAFSDDAMETPVAAVNGKKTKTPKSSGIVAKNAPVTPKGKGFTPKLEKKATSEGAKLKKPSISQTVDKKITQSAGRQSRKRQKKGAKSSPVKLPFELEDDYDEDEDEDFGMDEVDSESDDSSSDEDGDDVSDSGDDDDDEDGNDKEEEGSESGSDESEDKKDDGEISFESDGSESDEITFKPSASSTKLDKKTKTPKSALKTPGTAKSTDKKVSIMVSSPESEKPSKKVATTPHPSLSKLKRRPSEETDQENVGASGKSSSKKRKTSESSGSELDAKPVMQELSFGDDDDDDEEDDEDFDAEQEDDSEGDEEDDDFDEDEEDDSEEDEEDDLDEDDEKEEDEKEEEEGGDEATATIKDGIDKEGKAGKRKMEAATAEEDGGPPEKKTKRGK